MLTLALVCAFFCLSCLVGTTSSLATTPGKVTFSDISGGNLGSTLDTVTVGSISTKLLPEQNVLYLPASAPSTLSYTVTFPSSETLSTESLTDETGLEETMTIEMPLSWASEILRYGTISADGWSITYDGSTYAISDLYTTVDVPAVADTTIDETGGDVISLTPAGGSGIASAGDSSATAGQTPMDVTAPSGAPSVAPSSGAVPDAYDGSESQTSGSVAAASARETSGHLTPETDVEGDANVEGPLTSDPTSEGSVVTGDVPTGSDTVTGSTSSIGSIPGSGPSSGTSPVDDGSPSSQGASSSGTSTTLGGDSTSTSVATPGSAAASASAALAAQSDSTASSGTVDLSTCTPLTDSEGRTYYHLIFSDGSVSIHVYVYRSSSVASMYISTSQGLDWVESNKENRDTGSTMALVEPDGSTTYNARLSKMKGRGNSTWSYVKKPYQIKLAKKSELVAGAGAAKTWVLLANAADESMMRNWLVSDLGLSCGLSFTICGRPVDLYIDGTYRGAYYLCEKVQVGNSRVEIDDLEGANSDANEGIDIDSLTPTILASTAGTPFSRLLSVSYTDGFSSPSDITGGYLLEQDQYYYSSEATWFKTGSGTCFTVKSPEKASADETAYITDFVADADEALASSTGYNSKGRHFSEYIDIASFAKMFAIQELMGNYDFFCSSMYFYKDADVNGVPGKLYAGPLWDFDDSLGSMGSWLGLSNADIMVEDSGARNPCSAWLGYLLSHPEFKAAVAQAYSSLLSEVGSLLGSGIDGYASSVADSAGMDELRWSVYRTQGALPWDGSVNDVGDHAGAVENMSALLSTRSSALASDTRLGAYKLPDAYHAVSMDAGLAGIASDSPWFKTGDRATVRASDGSDISLAATWTENGTAMSTPLLATDETGVWSFTMPAADVTITYASATPTPSIDSIPSVVYTGEPIEPQVTVRDASGSIVDPSQYTVSYDGNVEVGTATATVTGNGGTFQDTVTGSFQIILSGTYRIASCLDDTGNHVLGIAGASTKAGAKLALYPTDIGDAQVFSLDCLPDGTYTIRNLYSGLVLDVAGCQGASTPLGTAVLQWTSTSAQNQRWRIERTDTVGCYSLVSVDSGLVLDIGGASTARGAATCVWAANGGINQRYRFLPASPYIKSNPEAPGSYHDYTISLASSDSLVLDISGNSAYAGAGLELWTKTDTTTIASNDQKFRITSCGGGYYTICALNSYKPLDVSGGLGDATPAGTQVGQWFDIGGANQKWIIQTADDGSTRFVSVDSGLYLTVSGAPSTGARLVVDRADAANQTFMLTAATYTAPLADGTYSLNPLFDTGRSLDVAGASLKDDANIETWTRNEHANQHLAITDVGGGLYTMEVVYSGKYIGTYHSVPSLGSNVAQYTSDGRKDQLWHVVPYGDGSYSFVSMSNGFVLDIAGGLAMDGANVDLWSCNDNANQRFLIADASPLPCGDYTIRTAIDPSEALDITGGSMDAGANVELWTWRAGKTYQTFHLSTTADGYCMLTALSSEMALDVAAASMESGANVVQWYATGATNQQWSIVDTGDGYYSFVSRCNGLYLGVDPSRADDAKLDGANVAVWTVDAGEALRFKLD